jgi:death-on-curing protein
VNDVKYLPPQSLFDMAVLLGEPAIRDAGLLESAALRPQSSVFGEEAYPELLTKAAALLHSIVRNHPLVDGNKRLGWVAVKTFLILNGCTATSARSDAPFELVMAVATGELSEVKEIGARLGDLFTLDGVE